MEQKFYLFETISDGGVGYGISKLPDGRNLNGGRTWRPVAELQSSKLSAVCGDATNFVADRLANEGFCHFLKRYDLE